MCFFCFLRIIRNLLALVFACVGAEHTPSNIMPESRVPHIITPYHQPRNANIIRRVIECGLVCASNVNTISDGNNS